MASMTSETTQSPTHFVDFEITIILRVLVIFSRIFILFLVLPSCTIGKLIESILIQLYTWLLYECKVFVCSDAWYIDDLIFSSFSCHYQLRKMFLVVNIKNVDLFLTRAHYWAVDTT